MVAKTAEKKSGFVDQRLMKALGHPVRVRILEVVNERPISPVGFAREERGVSLSTASYHFKVLEECGCIECVEEVQRRGSREHIYQGTRRALFDDAVWKRLPKLVQGGVTATVLEGFIDRAVRAVESGSYDAREDSHLSWLAMVLDEKGWDRLTALLASMLTEAQEIAVEAGERMADSGEAGFSVTFAAAGFESAK